MCSARPGVRHDGLFDLVTVAGGFGTPPVGPQRERVRLVGGSLLVERVVGADIYVAEATTEVVTDRRQHDRWALRGDRIRSRPCVLGRQGHAVAR